MSQRGKSRLDERLIACLLSENTVSAAVRKCGGISVRTAQRRMKEPEFEQKFREAKVRLVRQATAKLTANSGKAADTLRKIFDDRRSSAAARVSAAATTLKLTLDSFELEELEGRIRTLEAQRNESL